MNIRSTLTIAALLLVTILSNHINAKSSVDLSYYLPASNNYLAEIPTPDKSLGFQVGEWHARPEQIERYFYQLAEKSPRVKLQVYAYSHEKRPLFLAYISSAKNIKQLETIRKHHLLMGKNTNRPAVTWMGYSVHGNEASGSNASMLFAYHLAAATDKETLKQLDDQIIIIDPMINPDGLARFAHWVDMYKSKNPNKDPNSIEHNEAWPYGRTNHYWFDLNRDWLLLQHPESQGRIKMFHQWKPNVLTDFHEMGTNSTYFFQPGVKSRQNPLTPKENFDLTAKIAEYHAKALDNIGSLYYSKENFDDFYYGKGSTYPDINGAIGILFEQASARGHIQESTNGDLSFPFAIRNHLTTSFSTVKAVQENRKTLLQYQSNFYRKAKLNAAASRNRAVVYSSTDKYRLAEFNKVLDGHQIKYMPLARDLSLGGKSFSEKTAFIIPLQQPQYSLIQSIFEKRSQFADNTFYDVSSWNMPLAFDLDYKMITRSEFEKSLLGKSRSENNVIFEEIGPKTVALGFSWRNFSSAHLLSYLHQQKIKVRTVEKSVTFKTNHGNKRLNSGDLIIPIKSQTYSREKLFELLLGEVIEQKLEPISIVSGLAISGPDIGSPSIPLLKPVKIAMLIGEGVNSYQAGEVWHLLDQRFEQDLSMMSASDFSNTDNSQYTHLIIVDGNYSFSDTVKNSIQNWVKQGGNLITQSRGSNWLAKQGWLSSEGKGLEITDDTQLHYSQMDRTRSENYIGGAIASTKIDLSHPLGFGLSDENLALFKRGQFSFSEPKEPFVAVARFSSKPLIAGYMSEANRDNLKGKTSILVQKFGNGKLIAFTDDMNFRGFWLGTSRVFANAIYFGDIINAVAKSEDKKVKP